MADQRPSSFIGLIQADEKLPRYPGTMHQGPVPDLKVSSCIGSRIPIKGASAGDHWYDMGHKFVAEHGEEFEKTHFIGVPHALDSITWESVSSVAYTTQHDFRAALAQIMAFATKKLDLKHRGEEPILPSDMQTYKTNYPITLSNQISQQDLPAYRLDDNHPRVKSTRHANNKLPRKLADEHPLSVQALGIYATEHPVFTREEVESSKSRALNITLLKLWGMVKPESFRAGIDGRPCLEDQLMFDRDAMYLLDQMASYAILWRTAFVGLCDGESVILVEFSEDVLRPGFATEKVWRTGLEGGCKMVVLGKEESGKVRATMLGWMLDSLHKTVKNDARIVPSESL